MSSDITVSRRSYASEKEWNQAVCHRTTQVSYVTISCFTSHQYTLLKVIQLHEVTIDAPFQHIVTCNGKKIRIFFLTTTTKLSVSNFNVIKYIPSEFFRVTTNTACSINGKIPKKSGLMSSDYKGFLTHNTMLYHVSLVIPPFGIPSRK